MQFDWTTFALEILNFLVLVWILKRFLYRPVLDVLDARQARVKDEMSRAEELNHEGATLKQDYEERLAHWAQERELLRQQIEGELAQERAAGMDRIRQSLADEEAKAHVRNAAKTAAYKAELIRQATGGAYANAAALLQRLASPALTASIVDLLVDDLATLPDDRLQTLRAAAQKVGAGGATEIVAAHPLADTMVDAIVRGLASVAGITLKPVVRIDPCLLAGVRIAIGECLLHGNLKDELDFFQRQDVDA